MVKIPVSFYGGVNRVSDLKLESESVMNGFFTMPTKQSIIIKIIVFLLSFLCNDSYGVKRMQYKILLADDDAGLRKMLRSYLEMKNYEVITAKNGGEALEKISKNPDLILLDINMPQIDGMEVCRRIRDKISSPIVFLTAKGEEEDRVNGLLLGGDDYILKPFSLRELDARIISHLNREQRRCMKPEYRFHGDLIVDYRSKTVQVQGEEIELTRLEYDIIEFLSMHPGQVFDKERIYEKVCGYDAEGNSRVVTELVRRIRGKIANHSGQEYIETVWGMGYRWKK